MKTPHLKLKKADRDSLEILIQKGTLSARVFRRATGLLELDRGKNLQEVARTLGVCYLTVSTWRDRYKEHGISSIQEPARPGRPVRIHGTERAKITALACSAPPEGHARWDLRLLAQKAVELGYCEAISHTHVGRILKKTN